MKRNSFLTLGAAIAVTMGLASCSNDINDLGKGGIPNGPLSAVVAPDAVVWSGNQTFGNTFTGQYSVGTRDSKSSGSFDFFKARRIVSVGRFSEIRSDSFKTSSNFPDWSISEI